MGTNNYIVYKHTSPSNKVYIGVTKQNPIKRWRYGYGYKDYGYFYKAIEKYGWNNITHEIIASNLTKEEAFKMEQDLIKRYKSNNRDFGYNCSSGGEGANEVIFSEERKQRISKAKMGHEVSEETREKIRNSQSGMNHWNFGRNLSQNTKDKISKAHKGMVFTKEHKKNLSLSHKGNEPWNKGKKLSEETINKIKATRKRKPVLCIETNQIYESIRSAYEKTNTNYNHIAEVCKGIRLTAGGYHWRFVGGVE